MFRLLLRKYNLKINQKINKIKVYKINLIKTSMYFRNSSVKTTGVIIIGVIILSMCRMCTSDLRKNTFFTPPFICLFSSNSSLCIFTAASIKKCPRNTNLEKCAEQLLDQIRPLLASGDFGNGVHVPSLEPLFLEKLALDGPELNVSLTNLMIAGPSKYQVKSVK